MAALLQKVHLLDSTAVSAKDVFQMGTVNGGNLLGLPIGVLDSGYRADFFTLSLGRLELHPLQNLTNNMVYAFSPATLEDVFVDGKKVFSKGTLLTVPEEKIVEGVRRVTQGWV